MKRVSKKQKRVRAKSNGKRKASQKGSNAAAKKKLCGKAWHLWLGWEHEIDRAAAEKLRQFPHVPRKKQSPFPKDVELGFTGHFHKGGFVMQDKETFTEEFVSNAEKAWYWRGDKRSNRKPRRQDSGMLETNAALSAGYARVLADLVRLGELPYVRKVVLVAGEAGMHLLCKRTGYLPGYMALHPDWEGTLSIHSGLWTVDPEKHVLVGKSAGGKRGRRGLRTLGDCFISLERHHRAIGLPKELMYLPDKNLEERDPDDWAASEEMDRVVREELGKLPNGPELLKRAEQYQREAAEDWLRRYRSTKPGVDKMYAEHEALKKRNAELEAEMATLQKHARLQKKASLLNRSISKSRNLADLLGKRSKDFTRSLAKAYHRMPKYVVITYTVPKWMTRLSKWLGATFRKEGASGSSIPNASMPRTVAKPVQQKPLGLLPSRPAAIAQTPLQDSKKAVGKPSKPKDHEEMEM